MKEQWAAVMRPGSGKERERGRREVKECRGERRREKMEEMENRGKVEEVSIQILLC